jgi:glycosyltransferase involved in cell wall biosynthesis
MRALIVSQSTADHLGGAEKSLLAVLDDWQTQDPGLELIVVVPTSAAMHDAARDRGLETLVISMTGWTVPDVDGGFAQRRLRARENAAATRALRRLIADRAPALVVTNTLVLPWGALAAAMTGVPHVWFVREFGDEVQGFHWPEGRDAALADIGRLSCAVVANSRSVAAMLEPFVPPGSLHVSLPPVNLEHVRQRAREGSQSVGQPFSTDARLRIGVLGRVTRSKGQWRLVESLGQVVTDGMEVCFVGGVLDPGAEEVLTARARQIAPTARLTFAGEQENPFAWMAPCDVAVIPSEKEAFGRSTLESLALGLPVVTTSSGAGAELVEHGRTGFLVEPEDHAALAAALDRYAVEPGLIAEHGRAARERADTIMNGPDGISAALDVLTAAVGAQAAQIPARWKPWIDALDSPGPQRSDSTLRVLATLSTVIRRGARGLRHPRRASRRLLTAVRALRGR